MKMNMIIGKRQIILATLVVALTVAVYINYKFNNEGESYITTETVEKSENYGDAQFVDKPVSGETSANYFADARLNRNKSRDQAVSAMKTMLEDSTL
ncbi:MAG: hypothetical protein RRZ73_06475, partial [Oscillospiraceae bacterium]